MLKMERPSASNGGPHQRKNTPLKRQSAISVARSEQDVISMSYARTSDEMVCRSSTCHSTPFFLAEVPSHLHFPCATVIVIPSVKSKKLKKTKNARMHVATRGEMPKLRWDLVLGGV